MTVMQRVADFLTLRFPDRFCDKCLYIVLDLKQPQQANQATARLISSDRRRFGESRSSICYGCKKHRKVTGRKR